MQRTLIFWSLLLLLGCNSYLPEERPIYRKSEYFQKTFTSKLPLVYRLNLPRVEDVPKYVALNSDTLLSKKADRSLNQFRYNCTGCLDKERLVTPIRIQYIPAGTKFTVIDEYLYHSDYGWPIADSEIHYLVVKDEFGNISEISKLSFKLNVVEEKHMEKLGREQVKVLENIKYFEKHKRLPICFCPDRCTPKIGDPSIFVNDFQLSSEVTLRKNPNDCPRCYKLIFHTLNAYMTAQYYFEEWGLYGTLRLSESKNDI